MTDLNVTEVEDRRVSDETVATVVLAETPYWWEVQCEDCPNELHVPKVVWEPIDPRDRSARPAMREVRYDRPGAMRCADCGFVRYLGMERPLRTEVLLRAQTVAARANRLHGEVKASGDSRHGYGVYVDGWRVTVTKTPDGALRRAMKELTKLEAELV